MPHSALQQPHCSGALTCAHPLQKVRNLLPYMKKLPVRRIVHFSNLTQDPIKLCLMYNASTPHGLPPATGTSQYSSCRLQQVLPATGTSQYSTCSLLQVHLVVWMAMLASSTDTSQYSSFSLQEVVWMALLLHIVRGVTIAAPSSLTKEGHTQQIGREHGIQTLQHHQHRQSLFLL